MTNKGSFDEIEDRRERMKSGPTRLWTQYSMLWGEGMKE